MIFPASLIVLGLAALSDQEEASRSGESYGLLPGLRFPPVFSSPARAETAPIMVPGTKPTPVALPLHRGPASQLGDLLAPLGYRAPQAKADMLYILVRKTDWPTAMQQAAAFAKRKNLVLSVGLSDTDLNTPIVPLKFTLTQYQS